MRKSTKLFVCLFVLVFSFLAGTVSAQICPEEHFLLYCFTICDSLGGGVWKCSDWNLDRCCWELAPGGDRCGEGSIDQCPECPTGQCGF